MRESGSGRCSLCVCASQPQPFQVPRRCLGTEQWHDLLLSGILGTYLLWFFLCPLAQFCHYCHENLTKLWKTHGVPPAPQLPSSGSLYRFAAPLLHFRVLPETQRTPFIFPQIVQWTDSWTYNMDGNLRLGTCKNDKLSSFITSLALIIQDDHFILSLLPRLSLFLHISAY